MISAPARALDPGATATTFPAVVEVDPAGPFNYVDTASSRADINAATRKLEIERVAIVGLGGSGSYVLDLVAKTPVREIHLFDADLFLQHNAFRAPGAATIDELSARKTKVAYFAARYSPMHRGLVPHEAALSEDNVGMLGPMAFVFLCLDRGEAKAAIVRFLLDNRVPFVDVGMGLEMVETSLVGVLRVTTATEAKADHLAGRISFGDGGPDDYSRNIQVADLNALNAAFAVVRWKKHFGFYGDAGKEHHMTYTLFTNMLLNSDQP